jgi:hypothetical protein
LVNKLYINSSKFCSFGLGDIKERLQSTGVIAIAIWNAQVVIFLHLIFWFITLKWLGRERLSISGAVGSAR